MASTGTSGVEGEQVHRLNRRWTLLEQEKGPNSADEEAYRRRIHSIFTFDTVETFWRLWNNYPKPSELFAPHAAVERDGEERRQLEAVGIFQEGIVPVDEDKQNAEGCTVRFTCRSADLKLADTIWENLVLRTIGETVNADEWTKLVGVRMSKKRGPGKDIRFEMWLTATKPEKFKDEFAGICQVNRKGLDPTRYHPGNPNHKETPHRGVKPRKGGRR